MTPRAEYTQRLERRQGRLEALERRHGTIANARLAVFVLGLVAAWMFLGKGALHPLWLAPVAGSFAVLLVLHEKTLRGIEDAKGAIRFYRRGLARLEDRWAGSGTTGMELIPPGHLYAEDLDLFGEGSLFELLCTAQTRAGEHRLAQWLASSAVAADIVARQEAVEELRDRLDLREDLALLGDEVRRGISPKRLTAWATADPVFSSRRLLYLSVFLALGTLAGILAWYFGLGPSPLVLVVVGQLIALRCVKEPLEALFCAVEKPERELNVLAHVLRRLESEPAKCVELKALKEALSSEQGAASAGIHRLDRIIEFADARESMMFKPFAVVTMLPVFLAYALEHWRAIHGARVAQWVDAVGRFEALCALACYAYEHPEDPFPEIDETGPCFEAEALGHPLLRVDQCVRNDVSLNAQRSLLIVSGSNMSGKSTLLRSVGINAVLAMAGAPVRARSLRMSPFSLGATLGIHDSIQSGTSRFYAEITRLRELTELGGGDTPLLFLIDELLHGTNSHDRRLGGIAILKSLVEMGGLGLATTHDLAIAESVQAFEGRASNVHFTDHLEGDRLVFDYRLRPGVVTRSNALELMRAVGLRV